jgi:hypothetical protein
VALRGTEDVDQAQSKSLSAIAASRSAAAI